MNYRQLVIPPPKVHNNGPTPRFSLPGGVFAFIYRSNVLKSSLPVLVMPKNRVGGRG
jgi:hypothetical protein